MKKLDRSNPSVRIVFVVLTALFGAHPDSFAQGRQPAAPGGAPETIGEKPDQATADEVTLRRQGVLLRARQLTLELDGFYTRSEQDALAFVPVDVGFLPTLAVGEQDVLTSILTARYGLLDDLQLVASGTLQRQEVRVTIDDEEEDRSHTTSGAVGLAVRYGVVKEGKGYPSVILSAEGQIPVEESSYAFGGSVALVKSIDPVALFASFRYRHAFSQDSSDPAVLEPEDSFSGTLGYALAVNDTISLSTAVSGVFTQGTEFEDVTLPSRERFSLQLGLTSLLREGLYVEPTVSFALNGPRSVTLGVSLPCTL